MGWLSGLPRHVSPSNSDVLIHDGNYRRNRFLLFEIKGPHEAWPMQSGQARLLRAQAGQPNTTVRVLRGVPSRIEMHAVTEHGVYERPCLTTTATAIRNAVASWLNGSLWRDAESSLAEPPATQVPVRLVPVQPTEITDWQGSWRCVDCGSRPTTQPTSRLGDLGWAVCATCASSRYFRRTA